MRKFALRTSNIPLHNAPLTRACVLHLVNTCHVMHKFRWHTWLRISHSFIIACTVHPGAPSSAAISAEGRRPSPRQAPDTICKSQPKQHVSCLPHVHTMCFHCVGGSADVHATLCPEGRLRSKDVQVCVVEGARRDVLQCLGADAVGVCWGGVAQAQREG